MAIQHRHGEFKDFDPNKMVTAELAVVTSGDPASPTGRTLYICFAPGIVKRIVSYEDFENELQNATEEIQQAFTQEIRTAISNSIAATNAADEAKEAADLAAEAARKAAEAAGAYVLGDISGKTIKFSEAETRENINTSESTATMFGKIKKWFADLKNIAFTGDYSDLLNSPKIVNNRITDEEGTVLDGRQGKAIQDEFDKLNTKLSKQEPFAWSGNAAFGDDGIAIIPCDKYVKTCQLIGTPIMYGEFLSFTFSASNGKILCRGLSGSQLASGMVWVSVLGFVEYTIQ